MWINTGVNARRREGVFMDIKQRMLQLLPLSESMYMQDGEEPILEFCGKNREMICCRRRRKFKDN